MGGYFKYMHRRTLILFVLLIIFTSVSYAEDNKLEALQAQMAEVRRNIEQLQESNDDLKKKLASKENEISDLRLALEKIEGEIAGLEEE